VALPNTGDKLNAPPEDDPHVTFSVSLQSRIPYHCWIHMKVGTPKGVSQANLFYVQFSDALDKTNLPVGVGFDQFLLSPARFLKQPPSEAVVPK
jgi:hypothetical protein